MSGLPLKECPTTNVDENRSEESEMETNLDSMEDILQMEVDGEEKKDGDDATEDKIFQLINKGNETEVLSFIHNLNDKLKYIEKKNNRGKNSFDGICRERSGQGHFCLNRSWGKTKRSFGKGKGNSFNIGERRTSPIKFG